MGNSTTARTQRPQARPRRVPDLSKTTTRHRVINRLWHKHVKRDDHGYPMYLTEHGFLDAVEQLVDELKAGKVEVPREP